MGKQHKMENEDWRLQGVIPIQAINNPQMGIKITPGLVGKLCAKSKYTETNITFGIPSAPALFLEIAFSAFKAGAEIRETAFINRNNEYVQDDQAFIYFEHIMTSFVFSYTALEAFANEEIPEDYFHYKRRQIIISALSKRSIERHVNLDTKLGSILPKVMNIDTPKGTQIWSDYLRLKEDRDRIIHLKSHDREAPPKGPPSIWQYFFSQNLPKYPEIVKALIDHFKQRTETVMIPRWFKHLPFE